MNNAKLVKKAVALPLPTLTPTLPRMSDNAIYIWVVRTL